MGPTKVARKLLTQVWHLLQGNPIEAVEDDKGLRVKLVKLASSIGKACRQELSMPATLDACVNDMCKRISKATPASG